MAFSLSQEYFTEPTGDEVPKKGKRDPKAEAAAQAAAKPAMTPQEMMQWNRFIKFVKDKGVAGSTDLDKRDTDRGRVLFDEFKKANPDTTIDYTIVPRAQQEFLKFQKFNNDFQQRHGGAVKDQFDTLSKPDGWFGSVTSQQELIPMEAVTRDNVGKLVNARTLGLMSGTGTPTTAMTSDGKPVYGFAVPKGAKVEKWDDGQYYVQEEDGADWMPITKYARS
jgi:hypothetical protein